MNKHNIVNLKCPFFLFGYSNLDIPNQALFNLYRGSALPLWCDTEDDQNFQSPPGHSRRPVWWRRYCMVLVCQGEVTSEMWHLTCDTGHMTHGGMMWYGVVRYGEHYEIISWSITLMVWEWLKSDMLHLKYDMWHMTCSF